MNKKQVQQRVLQNGKPLDLDKFEWDEKAEVFSTTESNLVIDFNNVSDCTFKTGSDCTFKTGSDCTFKTGSGCTFDTGEKCVVVRRDVYEVIELLEGKTVTLNRWGVGGYTIVDELLSGRKVELRIDGKIYTATIE